MESEEALDKESNGRVTKKSVFLKGPTTMLTEGIKFYPGSREGFFLTLPQGKGCFLLITTGL